MRLLGCLLVVVLACSSEAPLSENKQDPPLTTIPASEETKPASASSASAAAQPKGLPEGALAPGFVVRLLELDNKDPLSKEATTLVGLLCSATEEGLFLEKDFIHGVALCGPRRLRQTFQRARVAIVYRVQKTLEQKTKEGFTGDKLLPKQHFIIRLIDVSDAYFKQSKQLIGMSCMALSEMKNNGEDWFSGGAACGPANEYMFFSRISVGLAP